MQDPFFQSPVLLVQATQPLATKLALRTLPLHSHEVLLAFCTYQSIQTVIAPRVSRYLFPKTYPDLPKRTRANWDIHVVSFVQACVINTAALWVMYLDKERLQWDWRHRVWGYSGAVGMIQGFSAGYFLWDLLVCTRDVEVQGAGALAHAASALAVSSLGFVSSLD